MAPVTASAANGDLKTQIPDLSDKRLDELAEDGTTVLADAIRRYRERLREGATLSSFQARI